MYTEIKLRAQRSLFIPYQIPEYSVSFDDTDIKGVVKENFYESKGDTDYPRLQTSCSFDYYFFQPTNTKLVDTQLYRLLSDLNNKKKGKDRKLSNKSDAFFGSFLGTVHRNREEPNIVAIAFAIMPDGMPLRIPAGISPALLKKWLFTFNSPFAHLRELGDEWHHRGWVRAPSAGPTHRKLHMRTMLRIHQTTITAYEQLKELNAGV